MFWQFCKKNGTETAFVAGKFLFIGSHQPQPILRRKSASVGVTEGEGRPGQARGRGTQVRIKSAWTSSYKTKIAMTKKCEFIWRVCKTKTCLCHRIPNGRLRISGPLANKRSIPYPTLPCPSNPILQLQLLILFSEYYFVRNPEIYVNALVWR